MRARLELNQFKSAFNNAPKKYGYIFMLSLLTGQRIGDITRLKWEDIKEDRLYIEQSKTGARIAIPLSIRLEAIKLDLRGVLELLKNDSRLICNISIRTLRESFNKALPDMDNKPTYHEIRGLSARVYEIEKGAEFTKKLLGHKFMVMTDKYLDNRNNSFIKL
ncbi:tyrosine-type recombinase/integrase [Entomomonas moraniae]|uniref:tyrosine-type recombinase/integrase n=1 Tax=Entomomonas moraniae TaxID=2213226 RepID=UPI001E2B32F9|nr:tyrosine-type recombinase/integrase [Entomomonas moraniae]